ncbi:hypothetical protein WS72_20385 [Burkholderia savannae]|uniref:Uncharacterized protein n=1 Tax=Burkholderia savannae TaxID=1637837 RepID=A0ABR5T2R8_9BURK|nr:hypothetical protein WS72_20385 [Burkholderia savannae]
MTAHGLPADPACTPDRRAAERSRAATHATHAAVRTITFAPARRAPFGARIERPGYTAAFAVSCTASFDALAHSFRMPNQTQHRRRHAIRACEQGIADSLGGHARSRALLDHARTHD